MKIEPWLMLVFCGWFIRTAFDSLVQDYYGQEDYLALLARTWQPASTTVPIAVIVLLLALHAIAKNK